ADRFHRDPQQRVVLDVLERRRLARGTGHDQGLGAAVQLQLQQAAPGVEVDFAGGREWRRQRSDAAGKSQVGALEGTALPRRCYLRRRSTGKYAGPRVPGPCAGPVQPPAAGAALTDPDTDNRDSAARPSPNENHLLINAYTTHPRSPLLAVTRRIADSGCNLVDTRLSTVGRDVSVTALATGSWDAVAKL